MQVSAGSFERFPHAHPELKEATRIVRDIAKPHAPNCPGLFLTFPRRHKGVSLQKGGARQAQPPQVADFNSSISTHELERT